MKKTFKIVNEKLYFDWRNFYSFVVNIELIECNEQCYDLLKHSVPDVLCAVIAVECNDGTLKKNFQIIDYFNEHYFR